jgi:hypothetical protein
MILGRRERCFYCGIMIRSVFIPALGDHWWRVEDFIEVPEHVELHDCPMHPSKREAAS